jgi:hypothetical protein
MRLNGLQCLGSYPTSSRSSIFQNIKRLGGLEVAIAGDDQRTYLLFDLIL